jgi:hypothetical protein
MQSATGRLAASLLGARSRWRLDIRQRPEGLSDLGAPVFGVTVAAAPPGAAHEHEQRILQQLYTLANTLPSGIVQVGVAPGPESMTH